jgi:hypothetical protein
VVSWRIIIGRLVSSFYDSSLFTSDQMMISDRHLESAILLYSAGPQATPILCQMLLDFLGSIFVNLIYDWNLKGEVHVHRTRSTSARPVWRLV